MKVVTVLLGLKGLSLRKKDNEGRKPLSWASGNGHHYIVQALLRKDSGGSCIADNNSRILLAWATENGKQDIVKLLSRKGVNVGRVNSSG